MGVFVKHKRNRCSTYPVGAVQAIDVQLLISLLAGRRLALRRSASAARRRECRHAAMYTPSGGHPRSDHQLQLAQPTLQRLISLLPQATSHR